MTEIKRAIQALVATQGESLSLVCKVLAVDATLRTCDVEPINGAAQVYGVRLQAIEEQAHGIVLEPKVGSYVIVTWLSDHDAFVTASDEVERVVATIEAQELEWTKDGLSLKSGQADLMQEMSKILDEMGKLCDILNKFQVATSVGPSVSVMPHIVAEVSAVKSNISAVQKQLKTILK
jgi:hypothetical protein